MSLAPQQQIQVLHVDDEPQFTDMTGDVWRFVLLSEESTEVTGTPESAKIDTIGVTDTDDRG